VSQALNDLMNIKVTTVSKNAQSFNKVAASLYVVTAEDIRRSGAMNIPEALRLVPGVDVAQVSSGQYAVSIRGFNSVYADKLLVLIDGRIIYNNLFGGVYWEDQQTPMADIERIEVIRGPGTAIWGANAVQGIINIITKSASDTQGMATSVQYGDTNQKDQEIVRYGGKYGDGSFRIYVMTSDLKDGLNPDGTQSPDAWTDRNVGLRLDQGTDASGKLQVSGDAFQNYHTATGLDETSTAPYITNIVTENPDSGGDLLAKWEKLLTNGSTISFQADYSNGIHYVVPMVRADSKTGDIEFQDSLAPIGRHAIIVGLGYRSEEQDMAAFELLSDPNEDVTEKTSSGYIQDQISLSKTLSAQIGSKFENNNFTGWEYEPSAHIGYSPDDQHTLWVSASRAVRIPSICDIGEPWTFNASLHPGTDTVITQLLLPNPRNESEIVVAYEAGYRVHATSKVLVDLSAYYNDYSNLIGVAGVPSPSPSEGPPPGLVVPIDVNTIGPGHTYGGEAVSRIKFTPDWRVNFGYSISMPTCLRPLWERRSTRRTVKLKFSRTTT
jgi:iron complex outermembrane receptor protein